MSPVANSLDILESDVKLLDCGGGLAGWALSLFSSVLP